MNPGIETTDNRITEELRNELRDLSKSLKESGVKNEKLARAMFLLAIIQVLIGIYQMILAMVDGGSFKVLTIGFFLLTCIGIVLHYGSKKI